MMRIKSIVFIFSLSFALTANIAFAENLEDIYHQVLKSDPRLLIDSLGVDVGLAREKQALGSLLPQVSANASWTENERTIEGVSSKSYPGERYTLSVRQALFDLPHYYAWQRSKKVTEQYEFERQQTLSTVRLDTIEKYFNLLDKEDALNLVQEEKQATLKKVKQTQALFEKQRVKITEVYEVNARLDMLVSQEIEAMQARDFAKEGLSELTNTPVVKLSPLIESLGFIKPVNNQETWLASAESNNASLRSLLKSIDAAKENVKQQKARYYPVVDVQLSRLKSDIGYDNSLSSFPTTTDVASLNFSMPIYNGGQTKGRVSEAAHQLSIANANYEKEHRKVVKKLKDLYLGVNAMVRRIEAAEKAVVSAEKSYQAMNKSFELGIALVSEVMDSQQVYLQAKRNYQQAKYKYVLNKAKLLDISGKLDDNKFYEIAGWVM